MIQARENQVHWFLWCNWNVMEWWNMQIIIDEGGGTHQDATQRNGTARRRPGNGPVLQFHEYNHFRTNGQRDSLHRTSDAAVIPGTFHPSCDGPGSSRGPGDPGDPGDPGGPGGSGCSRVSDASDVPVTSGVPVTSSVSGEVQWTPRFRIEFGQLRCELIFRLFITLFLGMGLMAPSVGDAHKSVNIQSDACKINEIDRLNK